MIPSDSHATDGIDGVSPRIEAAIQLEQFHGLGYVSQFEPSEIDDIDPLTAGSLSDRSRREDLTRIGQIGGPSSRVEGRAEVIAITAYRGTMVSTSPHKRQLRISIKSSEQRAQETKSRRGIDTGNQDGITHRLDQLISRTE